MQELFNKVQSYSDLCRELGESELTITMFQRVPMRFRRKVYCYSVLQHIAKMLNGEEWEINWGDSSQYKWYPYFQQITGVGLVFFASSYRHSGFSDGVAFFKDKDISDFVGRTFIELYTELSN